MSVVGQDLSRPAASMACESANVSADLYMSAAWDTQMEIR